MNRQDVFAVIGLVLALVGVIVAIIFGITWLFQRQGEARLKSLKTLRRETKRLGGRLSALWHRSSAFTTSRMPKTCLPLQLSG